MIKDVIQAVVERIKKYRPLYEQNEMAVRANIVNPILKGLGWDSENPEEVLPNVFSEEGIPDYSLLKDSKKVLFIEAKNLSVDVEKGEFIRQLARYCFGEGMEYGVITNGTVWVLCRAFQKDTTVTERAVWKADLENEDMTAIISKLNTISKENIEGIETLLKKLQILDEVWQSLLEEPGDLVKGFVPVFDSLIKEGYPDYKFEYPEIEDFIKERVKELTSHTEITGTESVTLESTTREGTRPTRMKIGNESYEIRYAYEVLIKTAEWLIRKGKLKREDCPIAFGHIRNLVNTQSKHPNGKDFEQPKKLPNGLWIDTNYSANGCKSMAQRLLEKYNYPSNILSVT